jgi:hypothetical protein
MMRRRRRRRHRTGMTTAPRPGRAALLAGAAGSFAVAALHVAIVAIGAPAYRFFGAGERMARDAAAGSLAPPALTVGLVAVFAVWGCYALAGAGGIRHLPWLRLGLATIAAIYTLRGLILVPQLVMGASERDLAFSAVALAIGAAHVAGTARAWPRLAAA